MESGSGFGGSVMALSRREASHNSGRWGTGDSAPYRPFSTAVFKRHRDNSLVVKHRGLRLVLFF